MCIHIRNCIRSRKTKYIHIIIEVQLWMNKRNPLFKKKHKEKQSWVKFSILQSVDFTDSCSSNLDRSFTSLPSSEKHNGQWHWWKHAVTKKKSNLANCNSLRTSGVCQMPKSENYLFYQVKNGIESDSCGTIIRVEFEFLSSCARETFHEWMRIKDI